MKWGWGAGYSHLPPEPGLALFSEAMGAGTDSDTGTLGHGLLQKMGLGSNPVLQALARLTS